MKRRGIPVAAVIAGGISRHGRGCTGLCCRTPLDGESLPESKASFEREMERIYGPRKPSVIPAEPTWSPYP